ALPAGQRPRAAGRPDRPRQPARRQLTRRLDEHRADLARPLAQPAAPPRDLVAAAMSLARLLDEITAAVPDRAALITDGDTVTTYAELEGAVSSCAAALRRHGIGAGDRVAVLDRPGVLIVAAVLGAARAGASATLLLD